MIMKSVSSLFNIFVVCSWFMSIPKGWAFSSSTHAPTEVSYKHQGTSAYVYVGNLGCSGLDWNCEANEDGINDIGVYHFSEQDYNLTKIGNFSTGGRNAYMVGTENCVFSADALNSEVVAYRVNTTGFLTEVSRVGSGGETPVYLALKDDVLFAANYNGGDKTGNESSFTALKVNLQTCSIADQLLSISIRLPNTASNVNSNGRQNVSHPHCIQPHPTLPFAYGVDLGADVMIVYSIDTKTNDTLIEIGQISSPPGSGPRHVSFHPRLNVLYTTLELANGLQYTIIDEQTGLGLDSGVLHTVPSDFNESNYPSAVQIAPDGKYVYASNRGILNNIVRFSLNGDGIPVPKPDKIDPGAWWVYEFTLLDSKTEKISPWIFIAGQGSGSIRAVRGSQDIVNTNGSIITTANITRENSPVSFAFVPIVSSYESKCASN
eukprot:CFRG6055T1